MFLARRIKKVSKIRVHFTVRTIVIDVGASCRQRSELGEFLYWIHIANGLARPSVEAAMTRFEGIGGVLRQVSDFERILTK